MGSFQIAARIGGGIMLGVALLHATLGMRGVGLLGVDLPNAVLINPVLDSQDRFYGVLVGGFGVLVFYCLRDLGRYAGILRIICWTVLAGAAARLVSIAVTGLPTVPVVLLLAVEIVLPVILLRLMPSSPEQR